MACGVARQGLERALQVLLGRDRTSVVREVVEEVLQRGKAVAARILSRRQDGLRRCGTVKGSTMKLYNREASWPLPHIETGTALPLGSLQEVQLLVTGELLQATDTYPKQPDEGRREHPKVFNRLWLGPRCG